MKKIEIWTDGSYDNTTAQGGWAVVFIRGDLKTFIGGYGDKDDTVNTMEMTAILSALERAVFYDHIVIYTDSQVSVQIITKGGSKYPHLNKIAQKINRLLLSYRQKGKKVEFVKVAGHNPNNPHNSTADRLAVEFRKRLR